MEILQPNTALGHSAETLAVSDTLLPSPPPPAPLAPPHFWRGLRLVCLISFLPFSIVPMPKLESISIIDGQLKMFMTVRKLHERLNNNISEEPRQ